MFPATLGSPDRAIGNIEVLDKRTAESEGQAGSEGGVAS